MLAAELPPRPPVPYLAAAGGAGCHLGPCLLPEGCLSGMHNCVQSNQGRWPRCNLHRHSSQRRISCLSHRYLPLLTVALLPVWRLTSHTLSLIPPLTRQTARQRSQARNLKYPLHKYRVTGRCSASHCLKPFHLQCRFHLRHRVQMPWIVTTIVLLFGVAQAIEEKLNGRSENS